MNDSESVKVVSATKAQPESNVVTDQLENKILAVNFVENDSDKKTVFLQLPEPEKKNNTTFIYTTAGETDETLEWTAGGKTVKVTWKPFREVPMEKQVAANVDFIEDSESD